MTMGRAQDSPLGLIASDVTLRISKTFALSGINAECEPGTVTALLGPNGSGKTTLAMALAGWLPIDGGTITFSPTHAAGDAPLNEHVVYSSAASIFLSERRIYDSIAFLAAMRETTDVPALRDMLSQCGIGEKERPRSLSTGKRAALATAVALAAQAPITILDETFNGMDAATREYFMQRLTDAAQAYDRAFIVSSHLINELDPIAQNAVVLEAGRVVFCGETDALRETSVVVQGRRETVERFTLGRQVVSSRELGPIVQATVAARGENAHQIRGAAETAGLDVLPVSLQDAVVALQAASSESRVAVTQ